MSVDGVKGVIDRASLASIIATIAILVGLGYFIYAGDSESVKWLAAIGVGFLFKEVVVKEK